MKDLLKKSFEQRVKEESLHRILKCLDNLTEKQIWYRSNDNSNSIGNLILHISGNITQYIQHGIAGAKDIRTRDEEFALDTTDISKSALQDKIKNTIHRACITVNQLHSDDLHKLKRVQVFDLTIAQIIIHVIEHTSYHVGQITYITKMLTDQPTGYYEGMEL